MRQAPTGQDLYNVKDFGALGNGKQDDTTFIQKAINAAYNGGIVYFPFGTYIISSSLIVDADGVTLLGYGQRVSAPTIQIAPQVDPTYALIVGNTRNANSCCIFGLTFIGRNITSSIGKGILFRTNGGKMFQTKVALFGGNGIETGSVAGTVYELFFEDIEITTNGMNTVTSGDGLVIGDLTSDCEYHRVISSGDSPGRSTQTNGISINAAGNQKFVDCHGYMNKNDGLLVQTGVNCEVIGGEWENNGGNGIESAGTNTIIVATQCFGNQNYDIRTYQSALIEENQCSSVVNGNIFANSANGGIIGDNLLSGAFVSINLDTGASNWTVHDNRCAATGATVIRTLATNSDIHDNSILGGGSITEIAPAQGNNIHDNKLIGGGTITQIGTASAIRNNSGFNPRGHTVTQLAIAASTVAVTNTTGCDCTVYISGGTITLVSVGGSSVGITAAAPAGAVHAVRVPVGQTIAITYSVAPTWQWFGD